MESRCSFIDLPQLVDGRVQLLLLRLGLLLSCQLSPQILGLTAMSLSVFLGLAKFALALRSALFATLPLRFLRDDLDGLVWICGGFGSLYWSGLVIISLVNLWCFVLSSH